MSATINSIAKFNFSILFAAVVTFLLFYFMQVLIAVDDDQPKPVQVIKIRDATVPEFIQELFVALTKPEPIEAIEEPVSLDPVRTPVEGWGTAPIVLSADPFTPQIPTGDVGLADNIMIPLVRVSPNYPSRAAARGIEGFVELTFTVNELGNVIDPVVMYSEPQNTFDRAALQAILRWKYSPTVRGGLAVPTYDVRNRIVFRMESGAR